jgi:hypothetical protein
MVNIDMGLIYNVFFIHLPAEVLKTALMQTDRAIDETPALLHEQTGIRKMGALISARRKGTVPRGDLSAALRAFPDEETKAYHARTENRPQIYFRSAPRHADWTVGGAWLPDIAFNTMLKGLPMKILGFYLERFFHHIAEVYYANYHHGSNDGDIFKYTRNAEGTADLTEYPYIEGESENFERCAARIQKLTGVPIADTHRYFGRTSSIGWQYHLRFDIPRVKEETKKIP